MFQGEEERWRWKASRLPIPSPSLLHARPSTDREGTHYRRGICSHLALGLQAALSGMDVPLGSLGRPRISSQERSLWSTSRNKSWESSGALRLLGSSPQRPPQGPHWEAALKFGEFPRLQTPAAVHGTPYSLSFHQTYIRQDEQGW